MLHPHIAALGGLSVKRDTRKPTLLAPALQPHGSLGYELPAPQVLVPTMTARAAAQPQSTPPPALAAKPTIH